MWGCARAMTPLVCLLASTLAAAQGAPSGTGRALASSSPVSSSSVAGAVSAFEPTAASLTISRRVDEVNLVFTVVDGKGRFVNELGREDFEILDNHRPPEQLRYFQKQTGLPLRVGLLIDVSESIKSRFKFEQDAASVFLKKILRPETDEAFVAGFNGELKLTQDTTADVEALTRAVRRLKPGGETALFDAVVFACEKLRSSSDDRLTRRAIVLITDGADTKSHRLLYDAQQAAAKSEVVIFALSTNDPREGYGRGDAVLELMSRASGGSVLPAHEHAQLKSAFERVESALRSQYAVGYKPAAISADGSFHSIEVIPRKPSLKAQCRKGYFAPRERQP